MKAKFVKDVSSKFKGVAFLYYVDPPAKYSDYEEKEDKYRELETNYIVVSAANVIFSGPETYIFPSNENGKVLNWGELDGSYRGGLDHHTALRNAGYEIVD